MIADAKAQLSMDFLGGFVILFFSLVTVLIFLPTLFSTLQNPSIDLHPVAYRTSVLLAEDPGWWSNITVGEQGYNWEDHLNYTSRIGLASVKYGKGDACILDRNKTLALLTLYNKSDSTSYGKIQDLLGLKSSTRKYDYNITFKILPSGAIWKIKRNESGVYKEYNMTFGREIPNSGNVEKVVRILRIYKGFYPEYMPYIVPGINPEERWYPNWPDGYYPFDDINDDDKGQFDHPLLLSYPLGYFKIYNFGREPSATAVDDLDLYVTTDLTQTENRLLHANPNLVVSWNNNTGWSGPYWNGTDWSIDPGTGLKSRNFEEEINSKLEDLNASDGQLFLLSIKYHNAQGDVSAPNAVTWLEDPWLPTGEDIRGLFKLEVCIW
ncbi:MAG: hypothetical protein QXJ68_01585 [Methanocellales archaeon]